MKLSILLCGTYKRLKDGYSAKILSQLEKQCPKNVEYLYFIDNKKRTVGEKRNDLIQIAKGDYIVFVDDDDRIAVNYVAYLLKAIEKSADLIVFNVHCSVNGSPYKLVDYNIKYPRDKEVKDRYIRIPNHIMCWKRKLALKEKFPNRSVGEDAIWAKKMKKHVKSQVVIQEVLYFYDFSHQISETQ